MLYKLSRHVSRRHGKLKAVAHHFGVNVAACSQATNSGACSQAICSMTRTHDCKKQTSVMYRHAVAAQTACLDASFPTAT